MYWIVFVFCSVLHKLNRSMRAEVARVELEFWSSGRREPGMTLTENRSWGAMMGPARHLLHDLREVLAQLVVARRCSSFESLPSVLCPLCLFCLLSEKDPFKTKINLYKYFSACPRALGQQLRATLTLWQWVFEEARVATGTNHSKLHCVHSDYRKWHDAGQCAIQNLRQSIYFEFSAQKGCFDQGVSCFDGFGDDSQGFFAVYRELFEADNWNWLSQMNVPDVAHCERQLMQRRNSGRPVHLPTMVLQPFWIYSHRVHKCTLRWGQ